jgi:opacity protein-like surface antigen
MRLTRLGVLFAAACALAAPASAQTGNQNWFANAAVGPSFGTLGSTPVVDATGGYKLTSMLSIGGEFGVLPHAPFSDARLIAPAVPLVGAPTDMHVNAYHTNANLFVHAFPVGRLDPYATAGIGGFTGTTVADSTIGQSHLVQYQRETNLAENFGAGGMYRLTNWLGVTADYRHFVVHATDTQHVNRFTTGGSVFVR